LLTADVHFDLYVSLSSASRSRLSDIENCFSWVIAESRTRGCHALLVLGDLCNDRVHLPLPVISVVARSLRAASEAFAGGVGLLPGNHDSYLRDPSVTGMSMLKGLKNVRVFDTPGVFTLAGQNLFGMVPWYADPAMIEQGVEEVRKLRVKYLCGHAMLAGIHAGNAGVDRALFQADSFNHVFLGDEHQANEVQDNMLYLGAPCQFGFGDAGASRGFWILDTDKGSLDFIVNEDSPRFHAMKPDADFTAIRAIDYVRVEGLCPPALREQCEWVESEVERSEQSPVRIDLAQETSQEAIFRRYFTHVLGADKTERVEKLVGMAMKAVVAK